MAVMDGSDEAEEQLVLVDENDVALSAGAKFDTHRAGLLHRAFSVFVFNSRGELLIQKRAASKYHSRGKWANTCCGHPRPGEEIIAAGTRRLREELGLVCTLRYGFQARYRAKLDNDMIENEIAHILFGRSDAEPRPNPQEVAACRYISFEALRDEIAEHASSYAVWLVHYLRVHGDEVAALRREIAN